METSKCVSSPSAALACAALFLAFALAGQAQPSRQLLHHHVRPAVSSGRAALVGPLPATKQIRATIVLPLRNEAELDALLVRLSDPTSPDFRKFLTGEQFTERFGPTVEDYQAVVDYVQAHGLRVTERPANRLIVPFTGTVEQVEKAFDVSMKVYQHPTENRTFFSPDREPSLNLGVRIKHISGLNNYARPHSLVKKGMAKAAPATVAGSGPGGAYLGSDMRAAYYGGTALTGKNQSVCLFELDGFDYDDVALSFTSAGQSFNVPINTVLIDGAPGGPVQTGDDGEQVLDIVQAIGMAPGLSQVRVYVGLYDYPDNPQGVDDAHVFNAIANEKACNQVSVSWAWSPDDPETDETFFKAINASGGTIFVASGDNGAYDPLDNPLFYPAEDPYVTAVGGTTLVTNGSGGSWVSERAWSSRDPNSDNWGASGGGPSYDGLAIPTWQAGFANSSNGASSTVRNLPDVAAEADFDNYGCDLGECGGSFAGTSFAAPRWAGFLALVNEQAANAGHPPVGFLNPALYALGKSSSYENVFHDVIAGNNYNFKGLAYSAVPGYDLATGLGSPNGQMLIDALSGYSLPDFSLSESPATIMLYPCSSNSMGITVTGHRGFTGSVYLTPSNLPPGVTAVFGTNPINSATSLTLTASCSAPGGTALTAVTGTSGSLTSTIYVPVSVQGFSLSAKPASLTVAQNSSGTTAISVANVLGGPYYGSVSLAASGLPPGVTASFSPNPLTSTSVLTLAAGKSAAAGTYNVTVTGTAGQQTATTVVALTICAPYFTLSTWAPNALSTYPGGPSTSATIAVTYVGFQSPVTLAASNLPTGVTASISPNVTTGTSVITFTASSSAPTGPAKDVVITGTSGSLTATTTIGLTINPAFTLGVGWVNGGMPQGGSATNLITVQDSPGFSGAVTLSASRLPPEITASFNPATTATASVLTLTASASASVGTYVATITGSSGSTVQTVTLIVNVGEPFSLNGPREMTTSPGKTSTSAWTVASMAGGIGSVSLSIAGLPNGVTASFSPNPMAATSVLTLTASGSVTAGSYNPAVTGTSGAASVTTDFYLYVVPSGTNGFDISAPLGVALTPGASTSTTIGINDQGTFNGKVTLSVTGLPTGVTASFTPNPATANSVLKLTVPSSVSDADLLQLYDVVIAGSSGTLSAASHVNMSYNAPCFQWVSLRGPGFAVVPGSSGSTAIAVEGFHGFNGSLTFSASGLPNGVTASFSPNPTTGITMLTLTASSYAAVASDTITITATSGTLVYSAPFGFDVTMPPATFTMNASSGNLTVARGKSGTVTFTIASQNGFTPATTLSASGLPAGVTAAFAPITVTPAAGGSATSTLTLAVSSGAATGAATITVTGESGPYSQSLPVVLTVK